MTTKHDDPKPMGCSKSSSKKEVYNKIILPQERKISNNLTLHLEEIEGERGRREGKDREETIERKRE